jgi:hypothetical protein
MPVPNENFGGTSLKEAGNGAIDLAGEELPHFCILGIGLLLPANTRDALRVSDHKHGLRLRKKRNRGGKNQSDSFHGASF